jgi:hypothetical protein
MGMKKKRHHHHLYIPWYTSDDDLYDQEESEEDGWISYIRRNLQHPVGEESPFPDSSWSYTRHDSPFEKDDEDVTSDRKSDATIHDEVTDALYKHPDIDASNIKMIVLNGIVCLFGTVESLLIKRETEKVVRDLPGVWSVRNELQIQKATKRSLAKNF